MADLIKDTASQRVYLGKYFLASDGVTPFTGAIAASDILLFKPGASAMVAKNSGAAVHMSGGHYYADFDATDTNTYGDTIVSVHPATALENIVVLHVMTAAEKAARTGQGAKLADATKLAGSALAATRAAAVLAGDKDVNESAGTIVHNDPDDAETAVVTETNAETEITFTDA